MEQDFYELLGEGACGPLLDQATLVGLEAGQVLYAPGDVPDAVYFPRNSLLAMAIGTAAGDMTGVSLIGREGVAGGLELAASIPTFGFCIVQVGGQALRISAAKFAEAIQVDDRARALTEKLAAVCLAEAHQWGACCIQHEVESRYAEKLVKAVERTGRLDEIPLTQQALAMLLGVQRTTVTLVATNLSERGLIRGRRGRVEIRDLEALRRLSCRCRGDLAAYREAVMPVSARSERLMRV